MSLYTTSDGIWIGLWRKHLVRYSDLVRVGKAFGWGNPTLTLLLSSGRTVFISFYRYEPASAFLLELSAKGVLIDSNVSRTYGIKDKERRLHSAGGQNPPNEGVVC